MDEIDISMAELIEAMLDSGCNIIQSRRQGFLNEINQLIAFKQEEAWLQFKHDGGEGV